MLAAFACDALLSGFLFGDRLGQAGPDFLDHRLGHFLRGLSLGRPQQGKVFFRVLGLGAAAQVQQGADPAQVQAGPLLAPGLGVVQGPPLLEQGRRDFL